MRGSAGAVMFPNLPINKDIKFLTMSRAGWAVTGPMPNGGMITILLTRRTYASHYI